MVLIQEAHMMDLMELVVVQVDRVVVPNIINLRILLSLLVKVIVHQQVHHKVMMVVIIVAMYLDLLAVAVVEPVVLDKLVKVVEMVDMVV